MIKYGLILVPYILSALTQFIFPSDFDNNKKVFFQPPGYVFGINWTIIYLLLGFYLYLLISERDSNPYFLFMLTVYLLNLMFNMMWTPVVNTYKQYKNGIFIIALMILTTLTLISIDSNQFNRTLLIPYISWLLVALLLNIELSRLEIVS